MRRILPVLAVAVIALGFSVPSFGTPKRLDLKKQLYQPPPRHEDFAPARVGWDGAEQSEHSNAYLQSSSSATVAKVNQATLQSLLIPDWRVALALFAAILVLRRVQRTTSKQFGASHKQPSTEVPRAA